MRQSMLTGRGPIRAVAAAAVTTSMIAALITASPAQAVAPTPPSLIAPADGAVSAEAGPRLSVGVSDPDGDALTVTFEGRLKGATTPGPGSAEPFTIVALPDTQNYTNAARAPIIAQQAQWVVDTRSASNTQFVVQLGDLVSNWSFPGHWPYVSSGLKVLDDNGVPNAVVPGNHDFDETTGAHVEYDQWFPPSRYANATWTPSSARYGGYMGQNQFGPDAEDRQNMNNYSLFSAGGVDWLVLGLEWEASANVLAWADRVLAAHPDRQVIMFTHAFVNLSGSRRTFAQRPGGTAPETTWGSFVRTHCQVRLVLNGHEHNGDLGESRRVDDNACGKPVHQILSDYQGRANGGNGWLRSYRIDPTAGTLAASTYSPYLNQYETDADSAFTVPFPIGDPQPAPFQRIATVSASGSGASTTWTGLARDTAYEWRAVVSDGTTSTTSATWTTRTPTNDVLLRDDFGRTASNGWGTADTGQSWGASSPTSAFSVSGGTGRVSVTPGARRNVVPNGVVAGDASLVAAFAVTPAVTGSGTYATAWLRSGTNGDYRATLTFRASGAPNLTLNRRVGSTETTIATYRMTQNPAVGEQVRLRFETIGSSPTTVRAKAWVGATEPTVWHATTTDATPALQSASGGIGLSFYVSGGAAGASSVVVDDLSVSRVGAAPPPPPPPPPPPNVSPTAAITVTAQSERQVTVSATGSTDSDGTVTGWSWAFGDGSTATGLTASRTYAQDGTYTITLTVTDDDGATATTTKVVTVAASPPPPPPPPPSPGIVSDQFGRTVAIGWGTADVGGAWTVSGAASMYRVQSGVGQQVLNSPGATAQTTINSVAAQNVELRTDIVWSRASTQGALYTSLSPRATTSANDYRLSIYVGSTGKPKLDLVRRVNGATTTLASVVLSAVTVAPNLSYTVVVATQTVNGTTDLSAKLFQTGSAEPAGWQVRAGDSTAALQAAGRPLLWTYMSGGATAPITTSFDNLTVRSIGQ